MSPGRNVDYMNRILPWPSLLTVKTSREEDGSVLVVSRKVVGVVSLFIVIVLATSVWAGLDAQALIKRGVDKKELGGGPVIIFIACLGIWIIGFPYYLVKRSNVKRDRKI